MLTILLRLLGDALLRAANWLDGEPEHVHCFAPRQAGVYIARTCAGCGYSELEQPTRRERETHDMIAGYRFTRVA